MKESLDFVIPNLEHLAAARQKPVSVGPDVDVKVAMTLMLQHNFSQLPVIEFQGQGRGKLKGAISWQSIGESIALGSCAKLVRDCMDTTVCVLSSDTPLLDAINEVHKHDFIMVRNQDNEIRGPVAASDLVERYQQLAEPFLNIRQIEHSIREILRHCATQEGVLNKRDLEDLSFGDYKRVFTKKEVWANANFKLDQTGFIKLVDEVRVLRNKVMHFHSDLDFKRTLTILKNAALAFEKMAKVVKSANTPQDANQ